MEKKKINAREWYKANREKIVSIATFWLLPKKWRDLLSGLITIADAVFIAYESPYAIQVDEKN